MASGRQLRVVLLQPSKYTRDGFVQRFRRGYMVNGTLPHMRSMTPAEIDGCRIDVHVIDEYVHGDLDYLDLLDARRDSGPVLLALVGLQSHQFHRALDLAALARERGAMVVIGGPHPMTCDTTVHQGRGVSFALAEGELIWREILEDAVHLGELKDVYGAERRWQAELAPSELVIPSRADLKRYIFGPLAFYPVRGCPYRCNFCSIIKIAGRALRSQPLELTLRGLRAARDAGVRSIFFTSDNFNKYDRAADLLNGMIEDKINLPFYIQCDSQIVRQPELMALMARAGCYQIFLGVESFSRQTLKQAGKLHNHPEQYAEIVRMCNENGIISQFSNIIGFPTDTEASIREHLELLRAIRPAAASFYILTPIPGTEQYAQFLERGLITEPNMDRYDGTTCTWRHPNLEPAQLTRLVFECYRKFYSAPEILRRTVTVRRAAGKVTRRTVTVGIPLQSAFSRWVASRKIHPMSGGWGSRRLDRTSDYQALRRHLFELELAPLPRNLELSQEDEAINRKAKLVLPA